MCSSGYSGRQCNAQCPGPDPFHPDRICYGHGACTLTQNVTLNVTVTVSIITAVTVTVTLIQYAAPSIQVLAIQQVYWKGLACV